MVVLLDVNVLLYAHREESPDHPAYRSWLEELIQSPQAYGLTDLVLSSFLRIATPQSSLRSAKPSGNGAVFRGPGPRSSQSRGHCAGRPPLGDLHPALPAGTEQGESGPGCISGRFGHRVGQRVDHDRQGLQSVSGPALAPSSRLVFVARRPGEARRRHGPTPAARWALDELTRVLRARRESPRSPLPPARVPPSSSAWRVDRRPWTTASPAPRYAVPPRPNPWSSSPSPAAGSWSAAGTSAA